MKKLTIILLVHLLVWSSYGQISWNYDYIETSSSEAPDMVVDANNHLHVVYYKKTGWPRYSTYAYYDGTSWNTQFIDTTEALYMGNMVPIKVVLTGNGDAHFVYTVNSSKGTQIKYATTGAYNSKEDISKTLLANKCYPNPASNQTKIEYQLDKKSNVNLIITNQSGRVIKNKSIAQEAGLQQLNIDLSDISSGYYYYTLNINGVTETKTLTVIK
ncbi:MAG: hypothetical protein Kow0068_13770 [Marinilabiliales bacterium]